METQLFEWDPNHWKWDGDLFIATKKHSFPANSSSSCSENGIELEKKRRANDLVVEENLTLNLGNGKKTKLATNKPVCQVEECGSDLSKGKDYHRRHKVCEVHSKAVKALVANQLQRFCQQCSRFHCLQEFDEGKRSCRRRLAGHNKRRRKTQPERVNNNSVVNDNQPSGFLLMSILKTLSNINSNNSNMADQDLLAHLLQTLASLGSINGERIINNQNLLGNSELINALLSNGSLDQRKDGEIKAITSEILPPVEAGSQVYSQDRENCDRGKMNDFDLNDAYVDSEDGIDEIERSNVVPLDLTDVSAECPSWIQQESNQSSPPQTSGNSDSASAQSLSSSSGDAQCRTDRIVFKLFGKEPSDFPMVLRAQIFDWLAHSPTDIESYIRPGCVILTMYLRQSDAAWEELCCELSTSLSKLLDFCDDVTFWSTGWIYIRVPNQLAIIHNGQMVVDTPLPYQNSNCCNILKVTPIAVPSSGETQFVVKGFNLMQLPSRLLCALEGNYLEANSQSLEIVDHVEGKGALQYLKFSCSIPEVTGRGFIEVDDDGFSNSFFPFIVAEDDICTEIRTLEKELESTESVESQQGIGKFNSKNQIMEFIHEMGWFLHKLQSQSRLAHIDPDLCFFSLERFKLLIEFSMERDWCAVVKKLLNTLFHGMIVFCGEQPLLKLALSEMGLLHRAVRRNSRSMVEMLLRYAPDKVADELSLEYKLLIKTGESLFRPDFAGPGGLTPLHVAAGRDGSENILDALTDDPGKAGIAAWNNARDSTGFTPEDYARLRGHFSYIHLIQRKINKNSFTEHVTVDIFEPSSDVILNKKQDENILYSFEIGRPKTARVSRPCGICDQRLGYRTGGHMLVYKPAMLSMLAVAAVCVCVALLFKSSPQVLFVFRPFSWEMLEYGSY